MATPESSWPPLPLAAWEDTLATLHMWTQIVGKIRLALAPPINHWWHVTLTLTARGLTTLPMPCDDVMIEITFDFIDHRLIFDLSDGRQRTLALAPMSVADFYGEVTRILRELALTVHIWPVPVEIPSPIRFDEDHEHQAYDAQWVERWWRVLLQADDALKEFRGRFLGKCSPVHFFWGSFDLAVTRFNGKRAPERLGADAMTREAYSHEVISAGFWPGSGAIREAAFYAYAAPEPDGYKTALVSPPAAFYNPDFNLFVLRYDDMRMAAEPRDTLMEFFQTTYEAGATLAHWNRQDLEEGDMAEESCTHISSLAALKHPRRHVCEECVKIGSTWVHLRTCQTCGVTLCCDSSPNRHASKHARSSNHPVVMSAEPGERWLYCYPDDEMVEY